MAGLLDDEVAQILTAGKVKSLKRLLVSAISSPGWDLFKLCCTNWSPTSNDGYAQPDRAKLVYMIMHKMPFDFGRLAFDHILQLALKPETKLFLSFPNLVYQLIQMQRLVQIPVSPPAPSMSKMKKKMKKKSATGYKVLPTARR